MELLEQYQQQLADLKLELDLIELTCHELYKQGDDWKFVADEGGAVKVMIEQLEEEIIRLQFAAV